MTRKPIIFLLWLSCLFLLGHTVIKHDHFTFQQKISLQNQDQSILQDFFSVNLGPNHLEVYENPDSKSYDLLYLDIVKPHDGFEFDRFSYNTFQPVYSNHPLLSDKYFKASFLRGPPLN